MLKNKIEREYGLTVNRFEKYKDVYRLESREFGAMCLKPYDVAQEEVDYLAHVFTHLRLKGFKYGPELHLTRDGRAWVKEDRTYYMLTNWVIGKTPDFSHRENIRKALSALAKFHIHAQGLPASAVPDQRKHARRLPHFIASYKETLANSGLGTNMKPILELCDLSLHHLHDARSDKAIQQEEQASAFCHGDYNFPNLVLSGNRMHLIDFEASAHQTRMVDLAHILHRNYAWRGNSTLRAVEYYERKRPLTAESRYLLAALLMAPYPIVRALRSVKKRKRIALDLPSQFEINKYIAYVRRLMG